MNKNIVLLLLLFTLISPVTMQGTIQLHRYDPGINSIPVQQLTITLDGDPTDWPTLTPSHPRIKIDGVPNDWYTDEYPIEDYRITRTVSTDMDPSNPVYVWDYGNGNKYLYYRGEFIWFDALNDQRSGYTTRLDADITEVRISSNSTHLLILVRLHDLGVLGGGSTNPSIGLVIALDTDMNYHNGATQLIDGDTSTPNYAPWDYQVFIDLSNPNVRSGQPVYGDGVPVSSGGGPLDIYDPGMTDVSTSNSVFVASTGHDDVEIALAWSDVGVANPWNVSNVRFYVATMITDGQGNPVDELPGSDFIDVMSSTDTDTEVGDGVLDTWMDVGFNRVPEPVYYDHQVLDADGSIQYWCDLSNDTRKDYIPAEAFDTDIISFTIYNESSMLYMLIHMKGLIYPDGDITPLIAIVFDATPMNETDGVDTVIEAPTQYGDTDTLLGGRTIRNATWSFIIWVDPANNLTSIVTGTGTIQLSGPQYIAYTHHFIEIAVPQTNLSNVLRLPFRTEIISYALVNLGSSLINPPQVRANEILNITGANAYDTLSPYMTYGSDVSVSGYAINGEFYGETDDVWIDTITLIKYPVRIVNLTIIHYDFDNDSVIEIGEREYAVGRLEYWNGSGWIPLSGKTIFFYLVGSLIPLGSNTTNSTGYALLDLDDLARSGDVTDGVYWLGGRYNPPKAYLPGLAGYDYVYSASSNISVQNYTIATRPFISTLPEYGYIPLLLLAAITAIVLLGRRCSRNHC